MTLKLIWPQSMAYKIIIKPVAELELKKALDWYKDQKEGLDFDLLTEIIKVIESVKDNPYSYQKKYKNFRVSFTRKFRYAVHYTIEEKVIYIHAILHTSQNQKNRYSNL